MMCQLCANSFFFMKFLILRLKQKSKTVFPVPKVYVMGTYGIITFSSESVQKITAKLKFEISHENRRLNKAFDFAAKYKLDINDGVLHAYTNHPNLY